MNPPKRRLCGILVATHATALALGVAGVMVLRPKPTKPDIAKMMEQIDAGEISMGDAFLFAAMAGALNDVETGLGANRSLKEARLSANENAAIATLRSIAAAQQQLQSSCAIDTDGDGGGEFGFFGEMSGAVPMRTGEVLDPPFLATAFGDVNPDGEGDGVIERQGFLFKIYLPGLTVRGRTPGVAESDEGGASTADLAKWGSSNCEILWCAYAWPADEERGTRAFFVNQEGDLLETPNTDQSYMGRFTPPRFGAAYSNATANNMEEDLGLSVMGFTANDGNVWSAIKSKW